jgi:hypothetical protein
MIHHQMSLRVAIGNASTLYTTRIHEYMSGAQFCFSKINLTGVIKMCRTKFEVLFMTNGKQVPVYEPVANQTATKRVTPY